MTLTEATSILEQYHPHEVKVRKAIETVLSLLSGEDPAPSCEERFGYYNALIEKAYGVTPFASRSRDVRMVAWRRVVFLKLRQEGYSLHEIERVSSYDHSTILEACKSLSEYIEIGDATTIRIWKDFLKII